MPQFNQPEIQPIPQHDVVQLWTYFFGNQPVSWARDVASYVELAVFAGRQHLFLSHSVPQYVEAVFANELAHMGRIVLAGAASFKHMFRQPPLQCTVDLRNGTHVYVVPFITYQGARDERDEVNSIVALYGPDQVNVVALEFANLSKVGWDELRPNLPTT